MFGFAKRGEQQVARGSGGALRNNLTGALVCTDAHGRYTEAALNARIFSASTAAAGVAPGTALGTTGPLTLYNPKNSTKNLVILHGSMGYVSGTLGAGMVVWAGNTVATEAVPTGTAITARSALVSSGNAPTGVALTTSTLAAAPVIQRVFCILDAALATSVVGARAVADEVAGALVLPPGGAITLQGIAAAGTSPLVVFSIAWEEIDIM